MTHLIPPSVTTTCRPGASLPLIVTPAAEVLDAVNWAAEHRHWIEQSLLQHGALLFRGFAIDDVRKLEQFVRAISTDFPEFSEESSPRTRIQGPVYTSTDYPAELPIQFHNEYSYSNYWPQRIYFCCLVPSAVGGQTPIADSRKVMARLSVDSRERFSRSGVCYRRNYIPGMGVSWQQAFLTEDRAEVETRCRQMDIQCEWLPDDQLRTTQTAAAIIRHPVSRELTWFNHAYFFNIHALEPAELREFLLTQPEEDLSTNTSYGDGETIAPSTVAEIAAAFAAEAVEFDWEQGDVLLLDNMLTAHARRPYSGERKIATVLADACARSNLPVLGEAVP